MKLRFQRATRLAAGFCTILAVISTVGTNGRAADGADELPVQRVVMFSSGVSFYEHAGQVEGDAQVDLRFNVRDVNDLLKSMVLQDLDGGRISTVSYGSKDPVTRTLKTFSIDLTNNPTLADLLGQIRGEKIELEAPDRISGVILGVETRQRKQDDQVVEEHYLNLLTDDGLRNIAFDSIGRIKLASEKLDAELRQALAVLAMSHAADKKTVSLHFLGDGQRRVRVGYVQESPIWKTSYRLVLDDEGKPLLQGWAIVENTTEADWNNVQLTLVSGRPISFVMDLYQPLYVQRPEVKPELYASLTPRTYDQDLAAAEAAFAAAGEKEVLQRRLSEMRAYSRRAAPADAPAAKAADDMMLGARFEALHDAAAINLQQGVQSIAQAGDVGEMFRYSIDTPVSLERSRSAMLPIVNEEVQGEKVSIYNEQVHAKHPLNGLRLKNSTELHLMQGPITVFDGGAYAGDAQIQDLPPGTERLISYAMDLDTEVAPTSKGHPTQLVSCRIIKGVLQSTHKYSRSRSYVVKNSGDKAKTVLIEHPLDTTWTLVAPKEPTEKTRDMYRFAVLADPGKPAPLAIEEEQTRSESVAITNLQDDAIRVFLSAKVVSDEVKEALRNVIRRKAEIEAALAQRQEYDRQISVIEQEQQRIRSNMAELPKDSDLFRRYITKFTDQENQIEDLREKVTRVVAQEQELRKALDEYLAGLNLS